MSRRLRPKFGTCPRYATEKVKYFNRNVAEFDCRVLQAKHPEQSFTVFRCKGCGRWHVGKS